jgi:hypothetical protein
VLFADPRLSALGIPALENPLRLLRVDLCTLAHEFKQGEFSLTLGLQHRAVKLGRGTSTGLRATFHPLAEGVLRHTTLAARGAAGVATLQHHAQLLNQVGGDG